MASVLDSPTRWAAPVSLLALGTFAMGTDSFVLAGILPQLASGLHTSTASSGQVITAFALTYAVAAPIVATLTARIPRRPLAIGSLSVFALANLAAAAAPSLGLLLVARVVTAVAAAAFTPTASVAAVALAGPSARGRALAVVNGGLAVGTVLGVPVGTAVGQRFGWPASLLFIAAVALVAVAALAGRLPALPLPGAVPMAERLRQLVDPRLLRLVTVNTLATGGGILFYTYIAFVLGSNAHLTGVRLAVALLAWGIGGAIGAFGAGWLADRVGPDRTLGLTLTIMTLDLLAFAFAGHFALVLMLAVTGGASSWSLLTPINHALTGLAPRQPGVVISLNASGSYLGQALGAVLGGLALARGADARELCLFAAGVVLVALSVQLLRVRLASVGR
ncbi:MFS transporter [Cryptosporangium phraense]|uniref:MFS transporter n=1 Tax=Cryptosporangium phraense TaxID=2593070 RepID=A0A545AP56_9ACTN|nr:MFS transporter [Cryptosporangium phraense]TQS43097.1 MFS transporter [Cryptosporangium phraense]